MITRREFLELAGAVSVAFMTGCSTNLGLTNPVENRRPNPERAKKDLGTYVTARTMAGDPLTPLEIAALRIVAVRGISILAESIDNPHLRKVDGMVLEEALKNGWSIVKNSRKGAWIITDGNDTFVRVSAAEEYDSAVKATAHELQEIWKSVSGEGKAIEDVQSAKVVVNGAQREAVVMKNFGRTLGAELVAGTKNVDNAKTVYRQALKAAAEIWQKTGIVIRDINPDNLVLDASGNFRGFIDMGEKNPRVSFDIKKIDDIATWFKIAMKRATSKMEKFEMTPPEFSGSLKDTVLGKSKVLKDGEITVINVQGLPKAILVRMDEVRRAARSIDLFKDKISKALQEGSDLVVFEGKGQRIVIDIKALRNIESIPSRLRMLSQALGGVGRLVAFLGDLAMVGEIIDKPIQSFTENKVAFPIENNNVVVDLLELAKQCEDIKKNRAESKKPLADFNPMDPTDRTDGSTYAQALAIAGELNTAGLSAEEIGKVLIVANEDMIAKDTLPFSIISKGNAAQQLSGKELTVKDVMVIQTTTDDGRSVIEFHLPDVGVVGRYEQVSANGLNFELVSGGVPKLEIQGSKLYGNNPISCPGGQIKPIGGILKIPCS